MSALSSKASVFQPMGWNVIHAPIEEQIPEEQDYQYYPVPLEPILEQVLAEIPDQSIEGRIVEGFKGYYIKGGKAFLFHYSDTAVETSDYDLVATPSVADLILNAIQDELDALLHTNALVSIEGEEPFYLQSVTLTDVEQFEDILPNGTKVRNQVQSIILNEERDYSIPVTKKNKNKNVISKGVTLLDIIMTNDPKRILEETEAPTGPLRYMTKPLLDADLVVTWRDRQRKYNYVKHNRDPSIEKQRQSMEKKLRKSEIRYRRSVSGRKMKSRRYKHGIKRSSPRHKYKTRSSGKSRKTRRYHHGIRKKSRGRARVRSTAKPRRYLHGVSKRRST